jgi:microtubule-associated protein-like 6
VKHLRFWTLAGSTLLSKKAIVGAGFKMTTMLAVAFGPEDLTASAASNSQIWLWRGRQVGSSALQGMVPSF